MINIIEKYKNPLINIYLKFFFHGFLYDTHRILSSNNFEKN